MSCVLFVGHGFQFHKGTIRTLVAFLPFVSVWDFNSIKVRLEQILCLTGLPSLLHFNSIKVRLEHLFISPFQHTLIFQFHKGTIRTLGVFLVSIHSLSYFNSIKVRLELIVDYIYHELPQFQFHKGTIRTFTKDKSVRYYLISIP